MVRRNTIGNTALDFLHEQLLLAMKKIKISDGSIDKDTVLREITAYYERKFSSLTNDAFSYDFIDLFCGAGGLSIGLEQVGFKPIIAIDKDEAALRTYRFNRPWMTEQSLIHEDIRDLVDSDIFPHVPVIVGGPPCQGFSVVNKHKKENDERNELYKFYVHAVSQSKPKIFLMENVEGILKLYDTIKSDFANVGYITCQPLVLSPKDFGFPQSRKRAFILGIMDEYSDIADELYSIFKETVFGFACGVTCCCGCLFCTAFCCGVCRFCRSCIFFLIARGSAACQADYKCSCGYD